MNQSFEEYKLAIETQMHFNEILMKFRSFGITAVFAIYGFAITRGVAETSFALNLSPSQVIAGAGVLLTITLAAFDLLYFFPLLLGAVDRSTALERDNPFGLTRAVINRVSRGRAWSLVGLFYLLIATGGIALICITAPQLPPGA